MSEDELERLLSEVRAEQLPRPRESVEAANPEELPPEGASELPAEGERELPDPEAPTDPPPSAPDDTPRGPSAIERLLDLRTASVLSSRYVELKLSDLAGSVVLLAQAPVIGFLIGTAFSGKREHARMDLILALVAVWFGCFNGCREVVKERLIFLRERRAGVSVRAYVLSKLGVLGVLSALQCLILVGVVATMVTLVGSVPLVFVSLFSTAFAASCLGLLLSSISRSQNSLIALVPLALIPQLIFNEVTLGGTGSEGVRRIEWAMLGAWAYDALEALRVRPDGYWSTLLGSHLAILGMGLAFVFLAGILLRLQSEEWLRNAHRGVHWTQEVAVKKVLAVLAVILVLGGVALAGLQPWGFSLGGVEFAWSPKYRTVQQLGRQFMEDIEFKDWKRAASYHTWEEKQVADIPDQIRRLFGIKPEQLHIEDIRLQGVDISEDGLRARTRFKAHVEVLNSAQDEEQENKNRDMEINLYWQLRPASEALPPTGAEAPPSEATGDKAPSEDGATEDKATEDPATSGQDPEPDAASGDPKQPQGDAKQPDASKDKPAEAGEQRWFLYLRDSLDEAQVPFHR